MMSKRTGPYVSDGPTIRALARAIGSLVQTDGDHNTVIPALTLHRRSGPTEPLHCIYNLGLGVVAQGDKQVLLGEESIDYGPGQSMLTTIDLPVVSHVTRASGAEPFLGMMLTLDVRSIVQMASEMDEPRPRREDASRSISFEVLDADLLDALVRLVKLLSQPALVAGLATDFTPNAKLDVLLPRLSEVTEEGHKALVFSQFTSFLSIVRERLDQQGIAYEYLDGKTRNRAAVVERFQSDPDCKLFLISLKAGGQGLNLTAAEYVFLLDPWWNPAVEAQAIDRAHRIGQMNRVFAYRLITRDTVEEKVLELQSTKRELADAIINADNSVIRNITGDDLRLLLS